MRAVEGIIFGTLDAEDDVYLRDNFQKTNGDCIPIGASVGFFVCSLASISITPMLDISLQITLADCR